MPSPTTPICPKCAYDQSGEIATWTDRCPLQGTCPECGLTFQWFTVLNPDHTKLPWYVEHAPKLTATLKRTPPTLFRLILPPVFWRRVSITAAITLPMLLKWSVLVLIITHVAASVVAAFGRWELFYEYEYASFAEFYEYLGRLGLVQFSFNSLFAPLVTISGADNGLLELHLGTPFWENTDELFISVIPAFGAMCTWLFILTVIPTTRKLTKLRAVHIARAGILGTLTVLLLIEFNRVFLSIAPSFMSVRGLHDDFYLLIVGVVLLVWQLVFWPSAIIIGWKIRPAALLVLLGTIAATLGAVTLTLVIGLSI